MGEILDEIRGQAAWIPSGDRVILFQPYRKKLLGEQRQEWDLMILDFRKQSPRQHVDLVAAFELRKRE